MESLFATPIKLIVLIASVLLFCPHTYAESDVARVACQTQPDSPMNLIYIIEKMPEGVPSSRDFIDQINSKPFFNEMDFEVTVCQGQIIKGSGNGLSMSDFDTYRKQNGSTCYSTSGRAKSRPFAFFLETNLPTSFTNEKTVPVNVNIYFENDTPQSAKAIPKPSTDHDEWTNALAQLSCLKEFELSPSPSSVPQEDAILDPNYEEEPVLTGNAEADEFS